MNLDIEISNLQIAPIYARYKSYVLGVATQYAGTRLIKHINFKALDPQLEIALSGNFDNGFTTIRTLQDLEESVRSGEHEQLSRWLATVQLCTALEILFDELSKIWRISANSLPEISIPNPIPTLAPILIGNKTIKQIRKLSDLIQVDTNLNSDEVLLKIAAIVEVRNCITHNGGQVSTKSVPRLKAYALNFNPGDLLNLGENHFDSFFHYLNIHIVDFIKKI